MLLKGKTVLLTGASRGIGRAISVALAKEGAKLILLAHPSHSDDLKQVRCRRAVQGAAAASPCS